MRSILYIFRNLLGGVIAFFDIITRGFKLKRSKTAQQAIEKELENLRLYQFFACPFCIKTRRTMYKLNLPIIKHSVSNNSPYRQELLEGGGKIQTPCLRIETESGTQWMYDSKDIIKYLTKRFS